MWKRKIVLEVKAKDQTIQLITLNRIDFILQSQIGWNADELKIDVYNLSPEFVQSLYTIKDKTFILSAGYEDGKMDVLMEGFITNTWGRKELPNHVTTMWCIPRSAYVPIKPLLLTGTFVGYTNKEIIEAIVSKGGFIPNSTVYIGMNKDVLSEVRNTYTIEGTMSSELIRLGRQLGFNYQLTDSYVKIISDVNSRTVVDQIASGEAKVHTVEPWMIKGTPQLTVASTNIKLNLDGAIKAGDILDYTFLMEIGDGGTQEYNVFGIGDESILIRDPKAFGYMIYERYQIRYVSHTGSNYTNTWETNITGTVFNEYVTTGSAAAQNASGVKGGYRPSDPQIIFNANGKLQASFPGNPTGDTYRNVDKGVKAAKMVKFNDDQMRVIEEASGGREDVKEMIMTVAQIENRGHNEVQMNAVSPAGAVGPFQFMPDTASNLGVKDRTNFRQSVQGVKKYIEQIKSRYGDKFTPEAFYGNYIAGNELSDNIVNHGKYEGKGVGEHSLNYLAMANQLHND
jgi:hypothetical protein